jgi:sugar lactone lactonase YvrE
MTRKLSGIGRGMGFNVVAVAVLACAACGDGGNPAGRNGGAGGHAGNGMAGAAGGRAGAGPGGAAGGIAGGGGAAGSAGTGGNAGGGGKAGAGAAGAGGAAGSAGGSAGSAGGSAGSAGGAGGVPFVCPTANGGASVPAAAADSVTFLPNVTVATFAGGATTTAFTNPVAVTIESGGALMVADYDTDTLDRISTTATVSPLTHQTTFVAPFALATNANGTTLYAATDANEQGFKGAQPRTTGTIWTINRGSGAAANVPAGTGIGWVRGIGVLSDGRIVAADRTNHLIWLVDPTAGTKTVLAGSAGCVGGVNGTGTGAEFSDPYGLAVLPDDSIVVADYALRIVRRVTKTGVVTNFAGDGGPVTSGMGTIDGPAAMARFNRPQAVAADSTGVVYVSDTGTHRIRRIDTLGNVTTLAGDGTQGFVDGAGNQAEFYGGEGLAVSADGKTVYVADGTLGSDTDVMFHRVRAITIGP